MEYGYARVSAKDQNLARLEVSPSTFDSWLRQDEARVPA